MSKKAEFEPLVVEVKRVWSSSLEEQTPETELGDADWHYIQFDVGEHDQLEAESFSTFAGTPDGLKAAKRDGTFSDGRSDTFVILENCSRSSVEAEIRAIVASCTTNNWHDTVVNLRKRFRWEYEDINKGT